MRRAGDGEYSAVVPAVMHAYNGTMKGVQILYPIMPVRLRG